MRPTPEKLAYRNVARPEIAVTENPVSRELAVGTPAISLGPDLVASSLRRVTGEAYDERARGPNRKFLLSPKSR